MKRMIVMAFGEWAAWPALGVAALKPFVFVCPKLKSGLEKSDRSDENRLERASAFLDGMLGRAVKLNILDRVPFQGRVG